MVVAFGITQHGYYHLHYLHQDRPLYKDKTGEAFYVEASKQRDLFLSYERHICDKI